MEAKFNSAEPDAMKFTLELTLTLREWKRIRDSIANTDQFHATADIFADKITLLVNKAEQTFYVTED